MVAYPHQQDHEYKQLLQSNSLLAAEPGGPTSLKKQHSMERPQPMVGQTLLEAQVFICGEKTEEGA